MHSYDEGLVLPTGPFAFLGTCWDNRTRIFRIQQIFADFYPPNQLNPRSIFMVTGVIDMVPLMPVASVPQ